MDKIKYGWTIVRDGYEWVATRPVPELYWTISFIAITMDDGHTHIGKRKASVWCVRLSVPN